MIGVGGNHIRAVTGNRDIHRTGDGAHGDFIPHCQGYTEGIKSGPQVGARCWNRHVRAISCQPHRSSSAATASRFGATTFSESVNDCRAVSVSFSPLPVTVQAITASAGTPPAAATCNRPATDAAEAGSTKTPSVADRKSVV